MGGWGGPEKDQVLQHCLIHGLAIICHLQDLPQGTFPGSGAGLIGCDMGCMVRDPTVMWGGGGVVLGQVSMNLLASSFDFQVRAQGTSGNSQLSEES